MSSRLSVIFYVIVCVELGLALTVLPWIPYGWLGLSLSDWSSNYFLVLAARKTGHYGLQTFVASGWVRGAVSGVGILNLAMGIWQMLHFRQTVATLESEQGVNKSPIGKSAKQRTINEAKPIKADPLSDYPRRNR
jgi:hypothetical protein